MKWKLNLFTFPQGGGKGSETITWSEKGKKVLDQSFK